MAACGRVPVIAGCTGASTQATINLAIAACRQGADALLCAPPAYVKPTQDGIAAHIRAVAHAADRPIVLDDVPGRAAVTVADTTIARLFERGLIVAVKDATADLSRPPRLLALCGATLRQFSGDDATAAAHLAMGGDGCLSVSANVAPALCPALHRAWNNRNGSRLAALHDLLAPLHEVLFVESNPIPLNAALGLLRLCNGDVRLPLARAAHTTRDRLALVLADVIRAEEDFARSPRVALVP